MQLGLLENIIIALVFAVIISSIFKRFKIPSIIGYIFIGILVGPYTMRWFTDVNATTKIAEFGIVFLLFSIGLEFSLAHLIAMRKIVIFYGGLQVLLAILVTIVMGSFLDIPFAESIVIGGVIAMSSTAIVSKQLTEQYELHAKHGMNAIGILLCQDLAVIPLLVLIPTLANPEAVYGELITAVGKGLLAILIILLLGRLVLRPLFYSIAKSRSIELFTMTVLLVTLAAAWMTHFLGVSLALGAFLAGIMLGETEYRHQIEDTIRPFRDILLALFFISIGMQLNLKDVLPAWPWLLLLLSGLILFKLLLVTLIVRIFGDSWKTSVRTGIVLVGGGEFGFAILLLALSYKIIPTANAQVVLAAILLSMMISPLLIMHNNKICQWLLPKRLFKETNGAEESLKTEAAGLSGHVIICGYGRIGQSIARIIEKAELQFIAFDLDALRINEARLAGDNAFYADASHLSVLRAARIKHARAIVISVSETDVALKILQQVRRENRHIPVIVRSHDEQDSSRFYDAGASEVIPETFETGLLLASHTLLTLHQPLTKVQNLINDVRKDRYDIMQRIFVGLTNIDPDDPTYAEHGMHAVLLIHGAYAIKRQLRELKLEKFKVQLVKIRRADQSLQDIPPDFTLHTGDVMVMFGRFPDLERAERFLLDGDG